MNEVDDVLCQILNAENAECNGNDSKTPDEKYECGPVLSLDDIADGRDQGESFFDNA
jgi:hypothetical protein